MAKVIISKPQNYTNSSEHPQHPIITVNGNNPEYGFIMLRSESLELNQGWLRTAVRVGRIQNRVEELVKLVEQFDLKEGDNFSQKVMDTKLIVKEQNEPFYDGQEPKINPTTGEVVTHGGKEVYRNTIAVPEGSTEVDTLLVSDKVPVEAQATMAPNTEFAAQ